MSLAEALARSVNTAAVRLFTITERRCRDRHRAPARHRVRIAAQHLARLGNSSEVTPLEMTRG